MKATLEAMGIKAGATFAAQAQVLEQRGVDPASIARAAGVSTTAVLSPADVAKRFTYNSSGPELRAIARPGDSARDLGVQNAGIASAKIPDEKEVEASLRRVVERFRAMPEESERDTAKRLCETPRRSAATPSNSKRAIAGSTKASALRSRARRTSSRASASSSRMTSAPTTRSSPPPSRLSSPRTRLAFPREPSSQSSAR